MSFASIYLGARLPLGGAQARGARARGARARGARHRDARDGAHREGAGGVRRGRARRAAPGAAAAPRASVGGREALQEAQSVASASVQRGVGEETPFD